MFQRICLLLLSSLVGCVVAGQNTPAPPVNPSPPGSAQPVFAYKKINPQLQYAFIVNKPTSPHPQEGDQVMLNMQSVYKNRLLYSTTIAFKGKPGVYGVNKPSYKGDLIEAIMLMTPGDSIVCQVDADALYKNAKNKKPPFIKAGDKMEYFIKLVSIKPKEQVQKEQQAAFNKMMKEQQAKQKAAAAKQMTLEDKTLKTWFSAHKVSPVKTTSGMYYSIREEGSGAQPLTGDSVTMNYTGKLLDGTTFDSNTDTVFQHVMPFQFVLGRGAVIKGWDEGVALLKTGSKATFYIPSPLAYGPQARPGGGANPKGIPANSILIFNVELVSSKHAMPVMLKTDSLAPPVAPKMDTLKTTVEPKQ